MFVLKDPLRIVLNDAGDLPILRWLLRIASYSQPGSPVEDHARRLLDMLPPEDPPKS